MMKEKKEIREINSNEVEIFINIIRKALDFSYLIPSIYRSDNIYKFITIELTNKFSPYKYFGVFDSDQMIACAEFKKVTGKTVFLNMIATKPGFQKHGLGRMLINYATDVFLLDGFDYMELDVYNDNKIARYWYSNLGFKEISNKSFFSLNKMSNEIKKCELFINNYPQFCLMKKEFGFGFLDVTLKSGRFNFGFIQNDLILRNDTFDISKSDIRCLFDCLDIDNIYFIGEIENTLDRFNYLNKVFRLSLKF